MKKPYVLPSLVCLLALTLFVFSDAAAQALWRINSGLETPLHGDVVTAKDGALKISGPNGVAIVTSTEVYSELLARAEPLGARGRWIWAREESTTGTVDTFVRSPLSQWQIVSRCLLLPQDEPPFFDNLHCDGSQLILKDGLKTIRSYAVPEGYAVKRFLNAKLLLLQHTASQQYFLAPVGDTALGAFELVPGMIGRVSAIYTDEFTESPVITYQIVGETSVRFYFKSRLGLPVEAGQFEPINQLVGNQQCASRTITQSTIFAFSRVETDGSQKFVRSYTANGVLLEDLELHSSEEFVCVANREAAVFGSSLAYVVQHRATGDVARLLTSPNVTSTAIIDGQPASYVVNGNSLLMQSADKRVFRNPTLPVTHRAGFTEVSVSSEPLSPVTIGKVIVFANGSKSLNLRKYAPITGALLTSQQFNLPDVSVSGVGVQTAKLIALNPDRQLVLVRDGGVARIFLANTANSTLVEFLAPTPFSVGALIAYQPDSIALLDGSGIAGRFTLWDRDGTLIRQAVIASANAIEALAGNRYLITSPSRTTPMTMAATATVIGATGIVWTRVLAQNCFARAAATSVYQVCNLLTGNDSYAMVSRLRDIDGTVLYETPVVPVVLNQPFKANFLWERFGKLYVSSFAANAGSPISNQRLAVIDAESGKLMALSDAYPTHAVFPFSSGSMLWNQQLLAVPTGSNWLIQKIDQKTSQGSTSFYSRWGLVQPGPEGTVKLRYLEDRYFSSGGMSYGGYFLRDVQANTGPRWFSRKSDNVSEVIEAHSYPQAENAHLPMTISANISPFPGESRRFKVMFDVSNPNPVPLARVLFSSNLVCADVSSQLENSEFSIAQNSTARFSCALRLSPGPNQQDVYGCIKEGFNLDPSQYNNQCFSARFGEQIFATGFE